MKKSSIKIKSVAFIIITLLIFQSLNTINNHTYSTGFSNFHYNECPDGLTCCFGNTASHSSYICGKAFHIN